MADNAQIESRIGKTYMVYSPSEPVMRMCARVLAISGDYYMCIASDWMSLEPSAFTPDHQALVKIEWFEGADEVYIDMEFPTEDSE